MRRYDYRTVDVFTDRQFGGNPLAVFPDAVGLSDDELSRIALEINYSETAFVFPPDDPANSARVRIFTPLHEIPFAGHPNVGTGFVLAQLGRAPGGRLRFEELAGLVEVEVERDGDGRVVRTAIRAPRSLERGQTIPAERVARCVSIGPESIVTSRHPPQVASVGLPFVLVEIDSLETLGRLAPNVAAFVDCQRDFPYTGDRFSIHAYVPERLSPRRLRARARMFAPLSGTLEDPATGSANGALAAHLCDLEPGTDVTLELEVAQGVEMGRPSLLEMRATKRGGVVGEVTIGGRSVEMMRGTLTLVD